MKSLAILSLLLLLSTSSLADNDWQDWSYLFGNWSGTGAGLPGPSTGTFSFEIDSHKKFIVRRDHSDYPFYNGRPAFSHDGLMAIYQDSTGRVVALALDNEGHTISYIGKASPDGKSWEFLSDTSSPPKFRLLYTKIDNDNVNVEFWWDGDYYVHGLSHRIGSNPAQPLH